MYYLLILLLKARGVCLFMYTVLELDDDDLK